MQTTTFFSNHFNIVSSREISIVSRQGASIVSPREKEVLELLSNGQSSTEIASTLFLSSHTVNDHRKALKEKLKARNVAQMIRRGFELQLLNTSTY